MAERVDPISNELFKMNMNTNTNLFNHNNNSADDMCSSIVVAAE